MARRYSKVNEDIVFEEFDSDLVVLNLASGQYFGLNEAAADIWKALMKGGDLEMFEIDAGLSDSVEQYIIRLQELGLVVPSEIPCDALICRVSAAPTIDVYDDLSDLIMADPIHDVDAQEGWPQLPEQH